MAVKTFEREVKKLSGEFTNLIENYDFEEYDFHSIRQTLQEYIQQTYPNYNDYFRSDYVMMLIELFAYYGEMMAYRMDINMNEAYLSTAKQRKNIVKIADMLGYKYNRIEPAESIIKIDITDSKGGSDYIKKIKNQGSVDDILSKSTSIIFEPTNATATYFPFKLDYLLKNVTSEEFMNTLNNIFIKLEDFSITDTIKTKRVMVDNFEYYERSIFVDKFLMRFDTNINAYVEYMRDAKTFELQSLKFDPVSYFANADTEDALTYDKQSLYNEFVSLGFEFVLRYDKGNNIVDKNIFMYVPLIQGGTFTRPIEVPQARKSFKTIAYEPNVFNNPTLVRQYDEQNNLLRTYHQVDNLANHTHMFAFEANNTPDGNIELIFGDGKNSEILFTATKTLLFYRKNMNNSDEIMNVVNGELGSINLPIKYYDNHVGQTQSISQNLIIINNFNATGGLEAESDEQIKYMARKLRSIQDRFVTGSDYETAGMLHPRVKYTSVVLRSYIGKNSPRISNEFLDIYVDATKNNISPYNIVGSSDQYLMTDNAYFTESSVAGEQDSVKFVENGNSYFFDIFDYQSISPNNWFKYSEEMISSKNKGTIIKLTNRRLDTSVFEASFSAGVLNGILPLDYSIATSSCTKVSTSYIYFELILNKETDFDKLEDNIVKFKQRIIDKMNLSMDLIKFSDIKVTLLNPMKLGFNLKYFTEEYFLPEDLSYIWTHYKSDDMYINPSKSNIIEIYVTGIQKDLKTNIVKHSPLSSSEINKLVRDIDERKMISDIVQVYNASTYEVEVAIKAYKLSTASITDELLKSKISDVIDKFFDISNIPLGKHFHFSRLIEWIHTNVPEVQHMENLLDSKDNIITPSSTVDILNDKIMFTQIIEKNQKIDNRIVPIRTIEIIN